MKILSYLILSIALCCISINTSTAQINFADDFESYTVPPDNALLGGTWLVGANVFSNPDRTGFLYNYFSFPAPNGGAGFSSTADDGGNTVFNVYSDYANGDHNNGNYIEAIVFSEATLGAADVNEDYTFMFDHQLSPNGTPDLANDPNLIELSAFIKVLDPNNGFATVYFDSFDTSAATAFTTSSLDVTIDGAWDGFIIQWGFINYATGFAPTGVWYDNVSFALTPVPPVADSIPTMGEWGLISLSILLLIFGIVTIKQRQLAL